MADNNHADILIEDLTGAFERLLEVVATLRQQIDTKVDEQQFNALRERISVYDYSFRKITHDIKQQNKRIANLEAR